MAAILSHRFGGIPEPRGAKRLLDVGCGDGASLALLKHAGWDVWGVEMNAQAAARAAQAGARVFTGSFEEAPLPAESFDIIRMWHVLEHVDDPRVVIDKAVRLLAPGGELIIGVPNVNAFYRWLFGAAWAGWDLPRHLYHFSPRTVRRCVGRSALGPVQVRFGSVGTGLPSLGAGWCRPIILRGLGVLLDLGLDTLRLGDAIEVRAVKMSRMTS